MNDNDTKTPEQTEPEQTTPGILSEPFNLHDVWHTEFAPLVNQLYDLARQYNLPLVLAGCIRNGGKNDSEDTMMTAVLPPGRTPPHFYIAQTLIEFGPEKAMQEMLAIHAQIRREAGLPNLELPQVVKIIPIEAGSVSEALAKVEEVIEATREQCTDPGCTVHGQRTKH